MKNLINRSDLEQEIWLPVVGYEGLYEDSNLGRVKSLKRTRLGRNGSLVTVPERILRLKKDKDGYREVALSKDGKMKYYRVHRLVMKSFKPDLFADQYQINHRNCNKEDNRVSNLEYCTAKYNTTYSIGKSILQFTLEGVFVKEYSNITEAAQTTGIGRSEICKCALHRKSHNTAGGYMWSYKEEVA